MVKLGSLCQTALALLGMAALAGGVTREAREDSGVTGEVRKFREATEVGGVTGEARDQVREDRGVSSEASGLFSEVRDPSSEAIDMFRLARDLSSEARDLSMKTRDLSREARDLSRQARDLSGCERDRPELSNLRGSPKVGGVAGRLGLTHLHIAWHIDQVMKHTWTPAQLDTCIATQMHTCKVANLNT